MSPKGSGAGQSSPSNGWIEAIVPLVKRLVAARMRGRGGNAEGQDDIVQKVLEALWGRLALGTLDTSRPIGPFLKEVVRRTVLESRRRFAQQQVRPADGDSLPEAPDSTPWPGADRPECAESRLSKEQTRNLVKRAVEALNADERAVITKCYVEDKSQRDAASELGLPEHRVWYLHDRAFARLQKRLSHVAFAALPILLHEMLSPPAARASSMPPPRPVMALPGLTTRLAGQIKALAALAVMCTGVGAFPAHARSAALPARAGSMVGNEDMAPRTEIPHSGTETPWSASSAQTDEQPATAGGSRGALFLEGVGAGDRPVPSPLGALGNPPGTAGLPRVPSSRAGRAPTSPVAPAGARSPVFQRPSDPVTALLPINPSAPALGWSVTLGPASAGGAPQSPGHIKPSKLAWSGQQTSTESKMAATSLHLESTTGMSAGAAAKPHSDGIGATPSGDVSPQGVGQMAGAGPASSKNPGAGPTVSIPDCHVVASVPAADAKEQPITGSLQITWSAPIALGSLAGHLQLSRDAQESVDFTVVPDGEATVNLVPTEDLRFWGSYQLSIGEGITLPSGWPCKPATIAFSTLQPSLEPRQLLPMPANSIAIDGDKLFSISTDGQSLQVFSLPPSGVPAIESEVTAPWPISGSVRTLAGVVVAPAGAAGLWRSSADGAVSQMLATGGAANDVALFARGGTVHALVATSTGRLRLFSFDGNGPGTVSDHGMLDPGIPTFDLRKVVTNQDGSRIAFVDGTSLRLATCSGPAFPAGCSTVTLVDPGAQVSDMEIDGSTLFVGTTGPGAKGVLAYDLAATEAPPVAACGPDGACDVVDLRARDGEVIAAVGMRGAFRFGLAGGSLALLASYPTEEATLSVESDGQHVLAGSLAGPRSFEEGTAAVLANDTSGLGNVSEVVFSGDWAYVAAGDRGLLTYFVKPDGTFVWKDQDLPPGFASGSDPASVGSSRSVTLFKGQLLVAESFAGVSVYDLSDPANPARLRTIDLPDRAFSIAGYGDRAYVCDANNGVVRLDPSSSASPDPKDTAPLPGGGQCWALAIAGHRLYVVGTASDDNKAVWGAYLGVVDLLAVGALQWEKETINPDYSAFRALAVAGDHLLLAARKDVAGGSERRLVSMDISEPAAPALAWTGDDTSAFTVTVVGTMAFVPSFANGVRVYDVADGAAPQWIGSIATPTRALEVFAREGDMFVTESGGAKTDNAARGLRRILTGPLPL